MRKSLAEQQDDKMYETGWVAGFLAAYDELLLNGFAVVLPEEAALRPRAKRANQRGDGF